MLMSDSISRRTFVSNTLKAGAVAGLADLAFVNHLPAVSADQAKVERNKVLFNSDIEPLVRVIEDTPRSKLFDAVAAQMRQGVGYQQLLTGLFLAGVRGIQPRPVGFKFHAVLVVNSAHLASQAMPDRERWLPLFWALDNFKNSQEQNAKQGNWVMPAVEESKLPPAGQARQRFVEAMDNWDEEGADKAVAALVRNAGAGEIIELFWRYGARDFRDIGHKAIYVANSWRTMQAIGWRHAEPVMRSLAYALLEHEGTNPAQRDAEPDLPWRENLQRASQIRAGWQQGSARSEAVADLLKGLRASSYADACDQVVNVLNKGTNPANVWDSLFLRAGELLMQQPGIVGIHCVTSVNALHYGYQASGNDETRRMLMLQTAAFLALFDKRMAGKKDDQRKVETLEPIAVHSKGAEAVEEVLADISKDRMTAARKVIALVENDPAHTEALMTSARRLIFSKGRDSHDYKFSSAALEDYFHTTGPWRARYLATSMFNLHGSGDRNNNLIDRARAVLSKV
jgi:hypothetical protein